MHIDYRWHFNKQNIKVQRIGQIKQICDMTLKKLVDGSNVNVADSQFYDFKNMINMFNYFRI